jgi:MarR family transcriptional regulator for hemolysin
MHAYPSSAQEISLSDTELLRESIRFYDFEQRRVLAQFGPLTLGRVLVILVRRGPQSQADLVRVMSLEKSWISRAVDRLEDSGWVERQPNPDDGRSVVLRLTASGREEAGRIEAVLNSHAQSVLERIAPEQRRQTLDALRTLHAVLEPPFHSARARRRSVP